MGGALYNADATDSVLDRNLATDINGGTPRGGAASASSLTRCVVVNNVCTEGAGGAANSHTIDFCTIVNNFGHPDYAAVEDGSISNSIVWGNRSSAPPEFTNKTTAGTVQFSMIEGDPSTIPGPPLFYDRSTGDMHLLPGSPAIDAANPTLSPDPNGTPRDIGALPFDPSYGIPSGTYCEPKSTSTGCVARVSLDGIASLSGSPVVLRMTGAPTSATGLLLLSRDAASHTGFFNGVLCVGGTIERAGIEVSGHATGCGDSFRFTLDPTLFQSLGFSAGDLAYAQVWFRDVAHPDGTGVGLSDAVVMTIEP